jgi:predicted nucleic acid-binding protein
LRKRRIPSEAGLTVLASLSEAIQTVAVETYAGFEGVARKRLQNRDTDDWPVLATALLLQCPIWTEDTDFFGAGRATWTTDRVELFLQDFGNS